MRLGMAVIAFKGETPLRRCIPSWCIVGRVIFGQGTPVFLCPLFLHPTFSQSGKKIQVLTLHLNPLSFLLLLDNKASCGGGGGWGGAGTQSKHLLGSFLYLPPTSLCSYMTGKLVGHSVVWYFLGFAGWYDLFFRSTSKWPITLYHQTLFDYLIEGTDIVFLANL